MRAPAFRAFLDPNEIVVDSFAGGGGASTGIEAAIGRPVDIAINHSPEAIALHKANHPHTNHYIENIWEVDPREVAAGRRIGIAWFSPDCTHFSKAKGTQPRKKEIRGLAWVVIRWAELPEEVRPRLILLENVEEFQSWGPLGDDGRPDPSQLGTEFRAWLGRLSDLGYKIEYRLLTAADYGTPTTRRRLFLVARRDNAPIVWPEPTHGKGRPAQWRPAADIIDWSLPCPSIFDRRRPLADATLRRIAAGIRRFVVEASDPFIIPLTHHGDTRTHSIHEPVRTITAAHRGEFALCEPFVVRHGHYSTITGAGLREGCGAGTFRGQQLGDPLATVCATNDKHLVCPVVIKHYGNGVVGHRADRTLGTITTADHHSIAAAFVTKFYGTSTGSPATAPLPTVLSGGDRGGGHLGEVRAFLERYGTPLRARQRDLFEADSAHGDLGTVIIHGQRYQIVDITLRMLQPHELFAAQGFPADYNITPTFRGKPLTKTAQISAAGNSVCPQVAQALVATNASGRVKEAA